MNYFPVPLTQPVQNRLTNEQFLLTDAADPALVNLADVATIVTICNQPHVYQMLFATRCAGRPYGEADAQRFLIWAQQGWVEQRYFVFLIRTPTGQIAGTLDIKSATRPFAEIGYWMDATHPGVMTNAVIVLTQLARMAGYKQLFARVRLDNPRSARVLQRAGFTMTDPITMIDQHPGMQYVLCLDPREGAVDDLG